MKKLFAFFLAVMMFMTVAASAEIASTFTILDPALTIDTGAGAQTFDLTGMKLDLAATEGDPIYLRLTIQGDGEGLIDVTAQIADGHALLAFDGVSRPLDVDLPDVETEQSAETEPAELQMPAIDLDSLTEIIMSQAEFGNDEDGNMTFKLPYTALNEIMEAIAPSLESASIPGMDMSEVVSTFARLKESNSGADVEGRIAMAEESLALNVVITAVQNGEPTDAKLLIDLAADTTNGASLDIDAAGQAKIHIVAKFENGYVALNVDATGGGKSMALKFKLTASEEEEVEFAAIDGENAIKVTELEEADEALKNEFVNAIGNLINYILSALDR